MSLFPHKRGCVEAVDPLQSCVDATDGSLRSQESLESDPQKHGSRCYGDIGQSRTNKRKSFRKGPAGNTKCTTVFRPLPLTGCSTPRPAAAPAAAATAAAAGTGSCFLAGRCLSRMLAAKQV